MNAHLDIHANPTHVPSSHLTDDQSFAHLSDGQSLAHLTDDQIDDQLIGDLAATPAAHLAACAACSDRVAAAADLMASFGTTTFAWSERRSATLPIPSPAQLQSIWQQRVVWATACFAVVLGISLANTNHQVVMQRTETQPIQQASTQPTVVATPALIQTASVTVPLRPQQIAADSRMLKAIDNEMNSSDDDSAAALGLEPVSAHLNRSHTATSLQD